MTLFKSPPGTGAVRGAPDRHAEPERATLTCSACSGSRSGTLAIGLLVILGARARRGRGARRAQPRLRTTRAAERPPPARAFGAHRHRPHARDDDHRRRARHRRHRQPHHARLGRSLPSGATDEMVSRRRARSRRTSSTSGRRPASATSTRGVATTLQRRLRDQHARGRDRARHRRADLVQDLTSRQTEPAVTLFASDAASLERVRRRCALSTMRPSRSPSSVPARCTSPPAARRQVRRRRRRSRHGLRRRATRVEATVRDVVRYHGAGSDAAAVVLMPLARAQAMLDAARPDQPRPDLQSRRRAVGRGEHRRGARAGAADDRRYGPRGRPDQAGRDRRRRRAGRVVPVALHDVRHVLDRGRASC